MRLVFIFALAIVVAQSALAQIGTNTARIINAMSAEAIPQGILEFEPNIYALREKGLWDANGDLQKNLEGDSVNLESEMAFRINYAPIEKLEVGAFVPLAVYEAQLGVKYTPSDTAAALGLTTFYSTTIPMRQGSYVPAQRLIEDRISHSLGLGLSYDFSDRLICDLSAEYEMVGLGESDALSDVFLFLDVGYFMWDDILLFNSIGYQRIHPELSDAYVLTAYPGFTISRAERFVIQVNGQWDLSGKNTARLYGGSLVLTLLFD